MATPACRPTWQYNFYHCIIRVLRGTRNCILVYFSSLVKSNQNIVNKSQRTIKVLDLLLISNITVLTVPFCQFLYIDRFNCPFHRYSISRLVCYGTITVEVLLSTILLQFYWTVDLLQLRQQRTVHLSTITKFLDDAPHIWKFAV